MMYFQVFVVIGLRCGTLAAYGALKWPFACMYASMFDEIVMPMEGLFAQVTGELLIAVMLASMSHVIVFPYEFATAILARVRLDLFVCIHVILEVHLAHKRFGAVFTFEWFRCAIGMHPRVYLQIPFGGEGLIADSTVVLCVHRVCGHVCLNGGLGKGLLAQRTLHRLGVIKLVGVR